ncbi:NAD(P)-binding protein [Schizopora paradoxa]|uniref:NAD(P)-binding protein n=1 Tax=Schizopora paradoxa TaxID=27342 RepID=A0A0H2S0Q8_9AGAM|nr:NAD(P)-binding protein [Schizopora paradoxa]
MRTLAEIQRTFLSAPRFAVVGASKDQAKFGTKVLRWYQARELDVTPVHPKEQELEGVKTVSQLSELPSPSETSVSIITPPKVTLSILQAAQSLEVPALWLQPGAEDDSVKAYIKDTPGLEDKVILGGPCILVQGDGVIKSILADTKLKSTKAESSNL